LFVGSFLFFLFSVLNSINGDLLYGVQSDYFSDIKTVVTINQQNGVVTPHLTLGGYPNGGDFNVYDPLTNSYIFSPGFPPEIIVVNATSFEVTDTIQLGFVNSAVQGLAIDRTNSTLYALVKKDPLMRAIELVSVHIPTGTFSVLEGSIPGVYDYVEKCPTDFDSIDGILYYYCSGYEVWSCEVDDLDFRPITVQNQIQNIRFDPILQNLYIGQLSSCYEVGTLDPITEEYTKVACLSDGTDISLTIGSASLSPFNYTFVDVITPSNLKSYLSVTNLKSGMVTSIGLSAQVAQGKKITATVFSN